MQVQVQVSPRSFFIKLVGVTYRNPDGTDRQHLVRHLSIGQTLVLKPEPTNPYDSEAVAVFDERGQQLGYLPQHSGVALLIDRGAQVTATVHRVVGGGLLGFLFPSRARNYGCVLQITEGNYDWKTITPLMDEDRAIEQALATAQQLERTDAQAAVRGYREVIGRIRALDARGPLARAWRSARYPINRLTLVLERLGSAEDALGEILAYEQYEDRRGLPADDDDALAKRKQRLLRRAPKPGREAT